MLTVRLYITGVIAAMCLVLVPQIVVAENTVCDKLLITELQTGAAPTGSSATNFRYEFVEIYNCETSTIDLTGYRLIFKNAAGDLVAKVDLSGEVVGHDFTWAVHNSYKTYLGEAAPQQVVVFAVGAANTNALAADGGSVQLVNATETIIDTVHYGEANEQSASAPPSGQSIKRCTVDGIFQNSLHDQTDFLVTEPPTLSALFKLGPPCQIPPTEPPTGSCEGLVLSEMLPNPSGEDEGQEFIEIFNPTSTAIPLAGCSLRVGENGREFVLPNEQLSPGIYRAFYDSQTGLTLSNRTATTVWLLSSFSEQGVRYADGLAEDQTWAFINDQWLATFAPTPQTANQLLEQLTGGRGAGEPKPCDIGEERNPETGRCRKQQAEATDLQPCKPGQERSPETNRCRSVVGTTSQLMPCKPGQERNPATNRCRSIATADTTLKPCAEGQERNPATNRCRKAAGVSDTLASIQNTPAETSADPKWWLAGVAIAAVVGYGVYEWRHEVAGQTRKLKAKLTGPPKP